MDLSPTKCIDVDLKITNVYCHPKDILVKFQGSYNTDREFDYHILQNEIQQVSKAKECVGFGEFCLVEDPNCGEWYRGRVIQKRNHIYEVFLIDNGEKLTVHDTCIASATDELFQLPPKMVCGIFANILPLEEKWSPKAMNYFSSLTDLQINGHVQAIMSHQTFLLDAPKITSNVVELQLGKLVDGDSFRLIVELLGELPEELLYKQMPDLIQKKYTRPDSVFCDARIQPNFQPIFGWLQPLLSVGGVELARISVAVSPSKFYCQPLQRLPELDELTGSMSSYYETINRENIPSCDSLGVLCAAKRKDGHWYRGVIQQLLSDNNVKIWFVDIGSCEAVPSTCVLKLQSKFISVPTFSFPCALSCLSDQNDAVRNSQLKEFKEALLKQSMVYIQIDLFDANEHLYYVTLCKHETLTDGGHLSPRSNMLPKCSPSFKTEIPNTNGDMEISIASPVFTEPAHRNRLQSGNCSDSKGCSLNAVLPAPYKITEMKIGSSCVAFVEYVLNPSNFWVQTNDDVDEFETMMGKISDVYEVGETGDKILENPEPGMLCCARYSKDMHFYRAVIEEVVDIDITVYFLDFGNTETVPIFDVRILLPEFQELPALAICCSLASAFPVEDIWIKNETDFFKNVVFGKPITLRVVGKENNKYSVNVQYMNGSEQADVLLSMVQAGYAECWQVKPDPSLNMAKHSEQQDSKLRSKKTQRKNLTRNNNIAEDRYVSESLNPLAKKAAAGFPQWERILSMKYGKMSGDSNTMCPYKEYWFKPGTVLSVTCCHSTSPGDFSCQLQAKLPELRNLMDQIQNYYETQTIPYQNGQLACVVKDSQDGKWYRACVLKYISKTSIEVVLVDYGNHISVLLENVQGIFPDFLTLECQAFRCCLSSVTRSLKFDPDNWTAEACNDFRSFISSSDGLLTCTIAALIIKSPDHLYNVVDLWTPSDRAQQFLLDCGHDQFCSLECPRLLAPTFSLYSFYYSSFDVNIGNVEEVCVTHIYSPTKFYCQLSRNADDIENLFQKITEISHVASCVSQINTHRLYLAKYFEDGLFYRALASPVGSSDYLPVYFVDFGNKQVVAKDELINIPDHASETLFTPMQAVKCYLSDLKDTEIPVEINKWFEENFLGKELKAVITAKESDGQLGVELYDNQLQISKQIKELLLGSTTECHEDPKSVNKDIEKPLEDQIVKPKENITAVTRDTKNKINSCYQNDGDGYAECGKETAVDQPKQCSRSVQVPAAYENTELVLQNTLGEEDKSRSGQLDEDPSLEFKEMPTDSMSESHIHQPSPLGQERNTSKQKYRDLLQCNIQPNSNVMVYVSFVMGPSNFYIHLEANEGKILQLAEELNRCVSLLEPQADIEESDVVLAEYEVDHCIYRAVVRSVQSEAFCEVEFIDYGNLSTVKASKIYKIGSKFLNLPRLSVNCFISHAKCMLPGKNWSGDITAYFVNKINNQRVICKFLRQHGEQWEVDLFCHGISVIEDLMQMEISLGLQNMPMKDAAEDRTLLPVANARNDGNNPRYPIVYKEYESGPTWGSLPKIPYQKINPGQLENAEIGHISRNGYFYVKLNKDVQKLLYLNMMATHKAAEQTPVAAENIQKGLECLTKSKITFKWHRAEVRKKFPNKDSMLVFFMDLGLYEMVSLSDTRRLSSKMRSIPRSAVLCKWFWIGNVDRSAFERVMRMLKGQEIKILFLRYLESPLIWDVDVLVNGILLFEIWPQLSNQGVLEKCNLLGGLNNVKMPVPKYSFKWRSISWAKFQKNRHYPGFVTSVSDPSHFCIQLEDSFKTMGILFKLLSDLPENLPTMPNDLVHTGSSCLIKTEPNRRWNRAEISDISDHFMLVFVDDGISVPIPISEFHRLKVIPEKLVNIPRLTYPCCLFGVSPVLGDQWNVKAKVKIQQFLGRQGLLFQFRQYRGRKMVVDVLCEGISAADVLVASGCAVYPFMSINWVEFNALNSQILHDPLQLGSQKSSDVRIILQPGKEEEHKKSDLLFKSACNKHPRRRRSKKTSKKQQRKKLALLSKRRKTEDPLKYNRSFTAQCCQKEGLKQTYPTDVSAKMTHAIPDPSGLSTLLGVMKITDENPSRKRCARKVKVD